MGTALAAGMFPARWSDPFVYSILRTLCLARTAAKLDDGRRKRPFAYLRF